MSTYFYLECLSHDPTLQSDGEVSQHDDEHVENAVRMAQGVVPVPAEPWETYAHFERNAATFLLQHPRCAVGLVTEYGEHRRIPGRGTHRDRAAVERQLVQAREARDVAVKAMREADEQITNARGQLHALEQVEAS